MRSFGELESDVMHVVWERGESVSIREIVASLNESRHLAHTTVITVAERLREKGWLTRDRRGRSYYYRASLTADEYSADLMSQVLDAAADRPAALLRFAGQLDAAEATALRRALAESAGHDPSSGE